MKLGMNMTNNKRTGYEIAVIGMSGRFPKAKNLTEYWKNLKEGKEGITYYSDEELIEAGISRELLKNPNYVKAGSVIEGLEEFDAEFFRLNLICKDLV